MAKQGISILSLTFTPSGSVSANRAIGFNGAQATVQGQKVFGVSPRAAGGGIPSDVTVIGTEVIETGGAFAAGASLIVDNQGRAIAATALALKAGATAVTSTAANGASVLQGSDLPEYVFADAGEASSGAGKFVEVLLRR